jgi:hypothetical protein
MPFALGKHDVDEELLIICLAGEQRALLLTKSHQTLD